MYTHKYRHTLTPTHLYIDRQTDRHTHTPTHTHTHTHRHKGQFYSHSSF